jgi:hypothetical protein
MVCVDVTCAGEALKLSELATRFTTCPIDVDVAGNTLSPLYCAAMACDPTLRVEVVIEAPPAVRDAEPIGVEPSRNCTLPVGVPAPCVTVSEALKVTA